MKMNVEQIAEYDRRQSAIRVAGVATVASALGYRAFGAIRPSVTDDPGEERTFEGSTGFGRNDPSAAPIPALYSAAIAVAGEVAVWLRADSEVSAEVILEMFEVGFVELPPTAEVPEWILFDAITEAMQILHKRTASHAAVAARLLEKGVVTAEEVRALTEA